MNSTTLEKCCKLDLKPPMRGKHLIMKNDASFSAANYALKSEDNPLRTRVYIYSLCTSCFQLKFPENNIFIDAKEFVVLTYRFWSS